MYRLCVPIKGKEWDREDLERLAKQLHAAGTDTVFLIFDRVLANTDMLKEKTEAFVKARNRLMQYGFTVNAWLAPTIGYGGKSSCDNNAAEKYTRIVTDLGRVTEGGFCTLDENFVADFMNTLKVLAETDVEEIMFEDDYTLTGGKMFHEHGCCCERHMKLLSEKLGENVSREFISKKLYSEDGLRYRHTFLRVMGETLADFTRKVEKTVHSVNPNIRIGLSANASSYHMEGITTGELSGLTAGETKPFIRMTGAPYWDNIPAFAGNIEAIRLQTYWLGGCGAELINEGDVYPRPRHFIPAAYLEGYDMVLRADGSCDGILKYMTDYTPKSDYETGYLDRHIRNKPHYEEIERRFGGKRCVGVNIVEKLNTFSDAVFGDDVTRDTYHSYGAFQPMISQWFAVDNSLPIAYGQKDAASIVFGENARGIDEETLKNGVIIDAYAAKLLMRQGIDVGIRSYQKTYHMPVEYFCEPDDYTIAMANPGAVYYDFDIDERAEVLSRFLKIKGNFGNYSEDLWKSAQSCPACYYYENDKGYRFLVYAFVAEVSWAKGIWNKGLFRSYYRQEQLCRGIEKLQGKRLPAVCPKSPDLYILCKKDDNSMAVGIWNFFADSVIKPEIILDGIYSRADFYNCTGRLEGDRIILDGEILPYSFAFFTVYDR